MTFAVAKVALNIIYVGLLLMVSLIDYDENVASKNKLPNSRLECKNHTLFMIKIAKIDTLFMNQTAEKPYPLGPHIPSYIAHIREYPLPPVLPGDSGANQ